MKNTKNPDKDNSIKHDSIIDDTTINNTANIAQNTQNPSTALSAPPPPIENTFLA